MKRWNSLFVVFVLTIDNQLRVFSGYTDITDQYYSNTDSRPSLESIEAERESRRQAEERAIDEKIESLKREEDSSPRPILEMPFPEWEFPHPPEE